MANSDSTSSEKLLDFSVYRRAIFNTPADKRWCVASVWDGRMGPAQCSRKPKHEYGGHGWCTQHYPPNEHAKRLERRAADEAKSKAQHERWDAELANRKLKEAALIALRQIAAGHNDPRGLALEILGKS